MKALVVHTLQGQWSWRVLGDRGALDITVTGGSEYCKEFWLRHTGSVCVSGVGLQGLLKCWLTLVWLQGGGGSEGGRIERPTREAGLLEAEPAQWGGWAGGDEVRSGKGGMEALQSCCVCPASFWGWWGRQREAGARLRALAGKGIHIFQPLLCSRF